MADETPRKKFKRTPRPVCPVHGWLMECRHTRGNVQYYYCPVDGCRESKKQFRHDK